MEEKVYISIPITGRDLEKVKKEAARHKKRFKNAITPFDVCPDKDKPYSFYMGKDIEALLECDTVFMCKGWEESKGCKAEFWIAKVYEKRIIFE